MDERPRHDGAFVVRIWWEHGKGPAAPQHWRGWAQHVRNGKQIYFQTSETLLTFIAEETGAGMEHAQPSEGIG